MPEFDQALCGAKLDCGRDFNTQLIEFGRAAKVLMTFQIKYWSVNSIANKKPFEQYLSSAPTCMFRLDETVSSSSNHYIDFFKILTDRI